MPIEVRGRAEFTDRYWYFLVDGITVAFVVALMRWSNVPAARVGLRLERWGSNAAIGVAAGILLVLLQSSLVRLFPLAARGEAAGYLQRGSLALWVVAFFAAAFAEEFWIAFCLVAVKMSGHSVAVSTAATAAVFGAVHFAYRFGALATALKGVASALLFLWCGSLIPMFLFHLTGNLGSLYWLRRSGH